MKKTSAIKNFVGKVVIFTNQYGYKGMGLVKYLSNDESYCSVYYVIGELGVHSMIDVDPKTPARLAEEAEYEGKKFSYTN
jgi:hypothetical protein